VIFSARRAHLPRHGGRSADDDVIGFSFEALIDRRLLEVEDFAFQLQGNARACPVRPGKPGGHISKSVAVHSTIQDWQQVGGKVPGARADFQDAQSTPFGQVPCDS